MLVLRNEHVEQRGATSGSPALQKSPLTFAAVQRAGGQTQPNCHSSGHTKPNPKQREAPHPPRPFCGSSPTWCLHPRCFSPCLNCIFAEIWAADFSSHLQQAQRDDSLPPQSSCGCVQGWSAVLFGQLRTSPVLPNYSQGVTFWRRPSQAPQ